MLGIFGHSSDSLHRLTALAHSLRSPTESNHVWVEPGPAPRTISVTTILEPGAATSKPRRGKSKIGNHSNPAKARAFYDRVQTAAAAQHLTIAHPILDTEYTPMRYDYMSGYLWRAPSASH